MAKTREVACVNYICEGSCAIGKTSSFYGLCQRCQKYSAKPGGKPARVDSRGAKARKIREKEMKEYDG